MRRSHVSCLRQRSHRGLSKSEGGESFLVSWRRPPACASVPNADGLFSSNAHVFRPRLPHLQVLALADHFGGAIARRAQVLSPPPIVFRAIQMPKKSGKVV